MRPIDTRSAYYKQLREGVLARIKERKDLKLIDENSSEYKAVQLIHSYVNEHGLDRFEDIYKIEEVLGSTALAQLIPQVIVGEMQDTQEAEVIASQLMDNVDVSSKQAAVVEFPVPTPLRANWIGEGQAAQRRLIDISTFSNILVGTRKFGLEIAFTDETIKDSQWDVVDLHLSHARRAMSRFREQWIFQEWRMNARPTFDNRTATSGKATTGIGSDGLRNGTLAAEDFIDLLAAMYMRGHTATDIIMHPLLFVTFAKTAMSGGLFMGADINAAKQFFTNPEQAIKAQVGGLVPTVWLAEWAPFDPGTRLCDMYVVDRNNLGAWLNRESLRVDNYQDVAADISMIKFIQRGGVVIYDEGKGIAIARNIVADQSWPKVVQFTTDISGFPVRNTPDWDVTLSFE